MATIADDIALKLAEEKGPTQLVTPGKSMQAGIQAGNQVYAGFQDQEKEKAANAFQTVLNQGFTGMVSAFKTADPEVQLLAGDPTNYQSNEDTMASWWAKFASAHQQVEKKKVVAQAADLQSQGKTEEAQKLLMTSQNITPETGMAGIDKEQQGGKIKDFFGKIAGPDESGAGVSTPGGTALDTREQGRLDTTVTNLTPYESIIQAAATKTKVPANLIKAVAAVESQGDTAAKSKAGALGIMQMMPETAAEMKVSDPAVPSQNIPGGAAYLAKMLNKYDGDVEKGLAAYNAGASRVDKLITKYGDTWKDHLPSETKDYIKRVPMFYSALGGGTTSGTPGSSGPPSQFEIGKQANAAGIDVTDPRFKEMMNLLNNDAKWESLRKKNLSASDAALEKIKIRADALDYSKAHNYIKDTAQVAPLAESLARIDKTLGGLDNNNPIPGFGLFQKSFRKFYKTGLTPDEQKMRTAYDEFFAAMGFSKGGKNFTGQERKIIENVLQQSNFADESAFRMALKIQRDNAYAILRNAWAPLSDETKKDFIENGVTNPTIFGEFKDFNGGASGAANPNAPAPAADSSASGGSGLTPEQRRAKIAANKAEIARLRAADNGAQ